MGKPCGFTQFTKSRILTRGHARIRISTTTHARIRIMYYKSRVLRLNVQWNWRFIWQNQYHHSTKLYWSPVCCRLALLLVLCTCNNTDGNKLVILSSTALHYGDIYIIIYDSNKIHEKNDYWTCLRFLVGGRMLETTSITTLKNWSLNSGRTP